MDLKEIIPGKVFVKLDRLPHSIELNLFSLEDNVWLSDQYPDGDLEKVYSEPRVKDVLKIFCRIMTLESKRMISKIEIIEIGLDGVETKLEGLSMPEKLFKITGDGELALIIQAVFEVRMRSNDIVQKINEKYQKKTKEALQLHGS